MRRRILAGALLAFPLFLTGCVFSVGSTRAGVDGDRLDALERRIGQAERELGIAAPAGAESRP